ncbi:Mitochondrial inner membrane protein oxa1 [Entomortierella beljakovae]|nr:Mitochondrial inner membrane protein oxa1 [Entomortierella beljakovae]
MSNSHSGDHEAYGESSGVLLEKDDYDHSSPEVSSLNSSAIEVPEIISPIIAGEKGPANTVGVSVQHSLSTETSVVDLNKTMPWKLIYPIASRETILSLCKATAINLLLPFINGVFLGFGEICAHELAYRWGWINSAHVVNVQGRRASPGNVGVRAAGSTNGSSGRSGIGGLKRQEDE